MKQESTLMSTEAALHKKINDQEKNIKFLVDTLELAVYEVGAVYNISDANNIKAKYESIIEDFRKNIMRKIFE